MPGDMLVIVLPILVAVIREIFAKILPKKAVLALLFNGAIGNEHKTKYALAAITDKYKDSISAFNKAIAFNVGFVVIAFYGYLVLPPSASTTIPIVGLAVSRSAWMNIVPLISYGLQTFIMTTFIWFMVLRLGMKLLYEEIGASDDFGNVTDILLDGSLGQMWIILRIAQYFESRWNLIWAIPLVITLLIIICSPLLICGYFISQLWISGSILLSIVYGILLLPYTLLFLLLIATAAVLGSGEFSYAVKGQPQVAQAQDAGTTS